MKVMKVILLYSMFFEQFFKHFINKLSIARKCSDQHLNCCTMYNTHQSTVLYSVLYSTNRHCFCNFNVNTAALTVLSRGFFLFRQFVQLFCKQPCSFGSKIYWRTKLALLYLQWHGPFNQLTIKQQRNKKGKHFSYKKLALALSVCRHCISMYLIFWRRCLGRGTPGQWHSPQGMGFSWLVGIPS